MNILNCSSHLIVTKSTLLPSIDHTTEKKIMNYRNATIFCVNFTSANFASPYSIANIRSQTLNNNLWASFLVGAVNEHRINSCPMQEKQQ